jgi:hypothetical protein
MKMRDFSDNQQEILSLHISRDTPPWVKGGKQRELLPSDPLLSVYPRIEIDIQNS